MSETVSISTGIAARYATALFELVQETSDLATLSSDVDTLQGALDSSPELRDLIQSPLHSRADQRAAIGAIAAKAGLSPVMGNTLALMAEKRRLFVLPALLANLRAMIAEASGEVTADVVAARPLSDAQTNSLSETLKERFGKDIKINLSVDESLIGGLVVRVGSKMIDTSIRAKLANLSHAMKEVG